MNQFSKPWRFLLRSIVLYFEEFYLMVGLSLLCSLALLTVVAAPAAAAGLTNVASRMVAGKRVAREYFWEGAKKNWRMTYGVSLLWLIGMVLFLFNVFFYANQSGGLRYVAGFWGYLAILWQILGFYLLPVLQRMQQPTIKTVYLNAFVLAFRQPVYSLMLLLQFGILSLLWRYLPPVAMLVWPGLMALLVVFATEFGLAGMKKQN